MKSILMAVFGCMIGVIAIAQNGVSTVTINVSANRNRQIVVDGVTYSVNRDLNNGNGFATPIVITDLQPGQHNIQVGRGYSSDMYSTSFTLRYGYDMTITVNNDGTVQLSELRNPNLGQGRGNQYGNQYPSPMPDYSFRRLVRQVRAQWFTTSKMNMIRNAFSNSGNYFTSDQARQLIQIVNSQPGRLQMAELAYSRIVDPENFAQVSNLILSEYGRNELQNYVASYDGNHQRRHNNNNGNGRYGFTTSAISQATFNDLYRRVQSEWLPLAKMSALTDIFANPDYYFTTDQARQLIALVSAEENRLQLAKSAYGKIVDPQNFNRINDLFQYQSSRDELATYVSSYPERGRY